MHGLKMLTKHTPRFYCSQIDEHLECIAILENNLYWPMPLPSVETPSFFSEGTATESWRVPGSPFPPHIAIVDHSETQQVNKTH